MLLLYSNKFEGKQMKKIIYTTLSVLLLSSCVKQPPAPIEFGSSKTSSPGYSEQTRSSLSDGDGITRRELSGNKSSNSTGELQEKEEAFTEYKEQKPAQETSVEEKLVVAEEKKLEAEVVVEEKKLKSLEEEMEEIEAQQKGEEEVLVQPEKSEEIVRPNKVVIDESNEGVVDAKFTMPVSGKIITKFGDDRGGKKSNGIDISAARGAGVKSIAAGKVVYAGQDPKFGNLVIVKVGSTEMFAAYAHMDDLLLQKDDDVSKGQVIGHVGSTGDVTNPELHFALRKGKTPVDPMGYLTMSK